MTLQDEIFLAIKNMKQKLMWMSHNKMFDHAQVL